MAAMKGPKGNGNTSKTATMRSDPNSSITVTSDPNGKPMSYTKWNNYTGKVTSSGKFPLNVSK